MQEITKHSHYVYRYYLRAWATNEQIWCLREQKNLFQTNLMKIGQENLFYEFRKGTDEEIAICYHFAANCCENMLKVYEQINNELRRIDAKSVEKSVELMNFVKQFEEKYFN